MVQLKRKVTLRTKEAPEVSAPKVEGTATKGPGVTPQPSSGGGKWWVAAVVVALLAAGGVYFVRQCGNDRTPSVATAGQNDSVVVDSVPAAASPSGGGAAASRWRGQLRRICADHGCFHIECSRFHIERSRISVEHVHLCADHGRHARTGAQGQCGTNRPRSDARRLWQRPSAQRPTRFPLRQSTAPRQSDLPSTSRTLKAVAARASRRCDRPLSRGSTPLGRMSTA